MSERICSSCGEPFPSIWATLPHLFFMPWRCPVLRDSFRQAYDLRTAFGWRYIVWVLYLELSARWGYKVRCFHDGCRRRVEWDPIVGAYCDEHWQGAPPATTLEEAKELYTKIVDGLVTRVVRDSETV